jgi:hypothetical protein
MIALIDFKTSKGGACYPEYTYQVSAYRQGYNRLCGIKNTIGIVVCLDKETGQPHEYVLRHPELTAGWKVFVLVRKLYAAMGIKPSRYYRKDEGYPSVTECLSILNKPALPQWAANSVNEHWEAHLPEIRNPDTSDLRIQQIIKQGKVAHRTISARAMSVGTTVHLAIETFLAGADPFNVLAGNAQALTAFQAYTQWHEKVNLKPIALEQELIWEGNGTCPSWGGTADCIAEVDLK